MGRIYDNSDSCLVHLAPFRLNHCLLVIWGRMYFHPRFLLFEVIAALLWNTLYCFVGYFIGTQVEHVQLIFERAGWVILGVLIVLFLAWRFFKHRRRRLWRSRRPNVAAHPPADSRVKEVPKR